MTKFVVIQKVGSVLYITFIIKSTSKVYGYAFGGGGNFVIFNFVFLNEKNLLP